MFFPAEAVIRLLHLNAPPNALRQSGDDEHYKVLVLDTFTKAVIAPLLRVNELRKHGITLHLSLDTQRDPIPDTPSIYFVRATEEAVKRIVSDAAAGLYDSFHLNFTPSVPAPLMDQLAGGAIHAAHHRTPAPHFPCSIASTRNTLSSLLLSACFLSVSMTCWAAARRHGTAAAGNFIVRYPC